MGSRRGFLRALGAGGVILAAGGATWALTRDPAKARGPWRRAGDASLYADPMRRALSYAILAPNPHNRQPWLVDLKSENEATLYCDLDRLLPATDPYSRQITIGLGCFLELFRLAAAEQGMRATVTPFPEGGDAAALDRRAVAHLRLEEEPSVRPDPLFAAILERRTDRSAYDTDRPPAEGALLALDAAGGFGASTVADPAMIEKLRDLTWRAWVIEVETPLTLQESIDLMRIGKAEINAHPDGLSLAGPLMEGLNAVGALTREQMAIVGSTAFEQTRDFQRPGIMSAMAYALVKSEGNERAPQIAAGASYVRMNLAATQQGLSMQPLSQALQEYAEMAPLYEEIHRLLAQGGETIQMLARLGYGKGAKPAPRWPLETKIVV